MFIGPGNHLLQSNSLIINETSPWEIFMPNCAELFGLWELHANTTGIKSPDQTQCTERPGKITTIHRQASMIACSYQSETSCTWTHLLSGGRKAVYMMRNQYHKTFTGKKLLYMMKNPFWNARTLLCDSKLEQRGCTEDLQAMWFECWLLVFIDFQANVVN